MGSVVRWKVELFIGSEECLKSRLVLGWKLLFSTLIEFRERRISANVIELFPGTKKRSCRTIELIFISRKEK